MGIFLATLGTAAGIAALAGWIAEAFTSRPNAAIVAVITLAALSVIFLLIITVLRLVKRALLWYNSRRASQQAQAGEEERN